MFEDRVDAGQQLAKELMQFKGEDVVVLALPRGGVVLGAEVARTLEAPLGLVLVRKIGHPSYGEYAIGAVAEDGKAVYNQQELTSIDVAWLEKAEREARDLIERRRNLYYGRNFIPPSVDAKTVIVVDDGIATGLTMEAAVRTLQGKAKRVIVAVPIAPSDSVTTLESLADEVIVLRDPAGFQGAVGAHYRRFKQVNDEEVKALLQKGPA